MGRNKADTWCCGEVLLDVEQVQIAINNCLTRKNVYARIDSQGWEIEKAITTPLSFRSKATIKGGYTKADVAEAESNGIYYKAFTSRIFNGHWTIEEAKTIPLGGKRK